MTKDTAESKDLIMKKFLVDKIKAEKEKAKITKENLRKMAEKREERDN